MLGEKDAPVENASKPDERSPSRLRLYSDRGFFAEGFLYRNCAGKLFYWRAYDAGKRNYKLPDARVDPSTGPKYTDQVRRLVWWESVDDGLCRTQVALRGDARTCT